MMNERFCIESVSRVVVSFVFMNSFLCLRYEVAGGIMFSGCPSVRTYVRRVLVIALSEEPIDGFLPNFGHVCILQSRWTD